jgi:hypothetical protein
LGRSVAFQMPILTMVVEQPSPQSLHPCRDCQWAECKFRVSRIKSYLIAYREASKCGDDPAEYIRDSIKPSRRVGEEENVSDVTDALIRGTKPRDHFWHIDVKVSLEQARDVGGLSLDSWNADAVARWLCARAGELPVDQ